jgi:chemotaxis signal transduction protein
MVENLRNSFNEAFARPREHDVAVRESFLAIRVAEHPYLLRLSTIASLHVRRQTVAVPSSLPELLGIAGFRGIVAPVYDLRILLGHQGTAQLPWLVLVRAPELLGLAFDQFERHVGVSAEDIAGDGFAESIRLENGEVRPVIHVASVVEALERRIVALPKES